MGYISIIVCQSYISNLYAVCPFITQSPKVAFQDLGYISMIVCQSDIGNLHTIPYSSISCLFILFDLYDRGNVYIQTNYIPVFIIVCITTAVCSKYISNFTNSKWNRLIITFKIYHKTPVRNNVQYTVIYFLCHTIPGGLHEDAAWGRGCSPVESAHWTKFSIAVRQARPATTSGV